MKTKLLIFLTLLLFQKTYSQEISKEEILKNKIESITEIDADGRRLIEFFNTKGDIIKAGKIKKDGTFLLEKEFRYNNSDQLDEIIRYNSMGSSHSTSKHHYNTEGQLVKIEFSYGDGVDTVWEYEHDTNGNKIKEVQRSETSGNSITLYKYNDNFLLVQEDKANDTLGKEEKVTYKYNDKKQLIEKKTKDYFSGATITQLYQYNESGKITKFKERSSNGVTLIIDYTYDENGILASHTWKSSLGKEAHTTHYLVNNR